MPHHTKKIIHLLGGALGLLFVLLGILLNQPDTLSADGDELVVTFFDVGQGDSILIQTPDFQNILIDGGPDETVLSKLGEYLGIGEGIDLMVLTHPHADHVAGLIEVLRRYNVDRVLATWVMHTTITYETWLSTVQDEGVPFLTARSGQEFILGDDTKLSVLYPFEDILGKSVGDLDLKDGLNDTSIVLRLEHGETSFLFVGDASIGVESDLMRVYGEGLGSDVLKVGHQGSRTSSSWDFLQIVDPEYGVIFVGENSYGHPHEEVVDRYRSAGIEVYRTDEEGDIVFISDGGSVNMQ